MTTSPDPARADGADLADPVVLLDQPFTEEDLVPLRRAVAAHADATNLARVRVNDIVLIAYELATNAVRHGGGRGRLRLWVAGGGLHCEVSDNGPGLPAQHQGEPDRPGIGASGGRGLWIALTFSDRLELANRPTGATITVTLLLP